MKNFSFVIPLTPLPTPRPRVARFGGVYYNKNYADYKAALEAHAKLMNVQPTEDDIRMRMDFFIPKPKKTVKVRPSGDLDNYAKGVLDSLNGRLYKDDDQVTELKLVKHWTDALVGWTAVSVD